MVFIFRAGPLLAGVAGLVVLTEKQQLDVLGGLDAILLEVLLDLLAAR